jgi:hypothetical protein
VIRRKQNVNQKLKNGVCLTVLTDKAQTLGVSVLVTSGTRAGSEANQGRRMEPKRSSSKKNPDVDGTFSTWKTKR